MYRSLGNTAYRQHYTYLWENKDPSPYLEHSFSEDALIRQLQDGETELGIISADGRPVGIFKLIYNCQISPFSGSESVLLEKLYLLEQATSQGYGKEVLELLEGKLLLLNRRVIWLDTMQKGRALAFYLNHGFVIYGKKNLSYPTILASEKPMFILAKELK